MDGERNSLIKREPIERSNKLDKGNTTRHTRSLLPITFSVPSSSLTTPPLLDLPRPCSKPLIRIWDAVLVSWVVGVLGRI